MHRMPPLRVSSIRRFSSLSASQKLYTSTPTLWTPPDFSLNYADSVHTPSSLTRKAFLKELRKPLGLYSSVFQTLLDEISDTDSLEIFDQGLDSILSPESQAAYLDSLLANIIFPRETAKRFLKATNGASLFPSCIGTHMHVGLGEHLCQNGRGIEDALRFVTYYRSPLMMEELYRMGWNESDAHRMAAKAMFMQFWSGRAEKVSIVYLINNLR